MKYSDTKRDNLQQDNAEMQVLWSSRVEMNGERGGEGDHSSKKIAERSPFGQTLFLVPSSQIKT